MNAVQSEAETASVPFVILALPCNQFAWQQPGNNRTEILNIAKFVRPGGGYEPNFPWFGMVDVNGQLEHPLFTYLKDVCPPYKILIGERSRLMFDPIRSGDVTWNFEKFLINPAGEPVARFDPTITVREIYQGHILPQSLDANGKMVKF